MHGISRTGNRKGWGHLGRGTPLETLVLFGFLNRFFMGGHVGSISCWGKGMMIMDDDITIPETKFYMPNE